MYERESDGRRVYRGARPGPEWHGHGTFPRQLWTLHGGSLLRITVHKQRWRHREEGRTCHSRPADDLVGAHFCSLVVAVSLWGWLRSEQGLHRHAPPLPSLTERPSRRTTQRWLRRSAPHADETATALRRAGIERSEPRPIEHLIGRSRAPPPDRRRWAQPAAIATLRSGLSQAVRAAVALEVPLCVLMAEARGRQLIRQLWLI